MMGPGWPGDGTPSIENLRELRLRALLNDLVNDAGPGSWRSSLAWTARHCGGGSGPPNCRRAWWRHVERILLERAVEAMEEDRQRVAELEERVSELEGQLAAAPAAVNSGGGNIGSADVDAKLVGALRQEFAREIQRLERRLDRPGLAQGGVNGPARPGRPGPGSRGATATW